MRKKQQIQMPLLTPYIDHPYSQILERISKVIDSIATISEMVWQDLTASAKACYEVGACGMSADQVLRAAIVKTLGGYSYEELAFHLIDSCSYRHFCRIGIAHKGFKKSALHATIKALRPDTFEAIHRLIVAYAEDSKTEKGRKVRIDCTVVDSAIHKPTDSSLLWDAVRVLTRLLGELKEQVKGAKVTFKDHTRRAKRRMLGIQNAKNNKVRRRLYSDLIGVTETVLGYARNALLDIDRNKCLYPARLTDKIREFIGLAERVVDQSTRRVINEEKVPSEEKIVSLFEAHTDIIKKDRRDTYYGHKICLTVGASNLVSDCFITKGNPADTALMETMLRRHEKVYGKFPLKVALDGGFASKKNLNTAKSFEIKDVCFGKKRGIKVEDMCRSKWVYMKLRRFRAGVESAISWLKRCFGLDRCNWKSLRSFHSYVWTSIITANLMTIARADTKG